MDQEYSARDPRPRPAQSEPGVGAVGVDPAELIRVRDEQFTYMELVSGDGNMPSGAFAMHGHLLRVLDRAIKGTSYRGEVEDLIEVAEQFARWRQDRGCKLSPAAAAIRTRSTDVLHRLAAALPEEPSRAADPDEDVASSIQSMTMTVEAFAHAIGKSSRTVYRMAEQGQLFVYRDGAGRGTVLIYRDQLDRANRPQWPATAKRPGQPPSLSNGHREMGTKPGSD